MSDKEKSRKLPRATLEQKIKILDYYLQSRRPQLDTVEKFKDEVAISTSTFNEWVKNQAEYRQRYEQLETDFEKQAKRKATFKYDKINRAMDLLVQQKLARGEPVTEPVLRGYWQIYAHQFGVDNPKRLIGFSHGWLSHFKRRHGLARKREDGKLVRRSNNAQANVSSNGNSDPEREKSRPQFQPQQTLSFLGQYGYYDDGRNRDEDSPPSQNTPLEPRVTAAEIERFIFSMADRFFHDNQYLYPQTMKIYQEFKTSFLSERLIDLRATKSQPVPGAQLSRSQLSESQISEQQISGTQLSGPQISSTQLAGPQLSRPGTQISSKISGSQLVNGQIPSSLNQNHRQIQSISMEHLNTIDSMAIPNQMQPSQTGNRQGQNQNQNQNQNEVQPVNQNQSQNRMEPRVRVRKQKPKRKSKYDPALQPLPLPQLLLLHPLARDQNMSQLRESGLSTPVGNGRVLNGNSILNGTSILNGASILNMALATMQQGTLQSFAHGDVRDGLDDMFARETGRYEGQWPKSALRKIWEQNKIMLS